MERYEKQARKIVRDFLEDCWRKLWNEAKMRVERNSVRRVTFLSYFNRRICGAFTEFDPYVEALWGSDIYLRPKTGLDERFLYKLS